MCPRVARPSLSPAHAVHAPDTRLEPYTLTGSTGAFLSPAARAHALHARAHAFLWQATQGVRGMCPRVAQSFHNYCSTLMSHTFQHSGSSSTAGAGVSSTSPSAGRVASPSTTLLTCAVATAPSPKTLAAPCVSGRPERSLGKLRKAPRGKPVTAAATECAKALAGGVGQTAQKRF